MPRLSRKQKLQNAERHKERVAAWKARTATDEELLAESRRAFEALSPEEQNILRQLSEYLQETGIPKHKLGFPMAKFFEIAEITDLNQKRAVYVLWNTGVFTDRLDKPPIRMNMEGLLITWWISTLEYGVAPDHTKRPNAVMLSEMLASMQSLVEKIPGFAFCCPYDQAKFPRGVDLVYAEFECYTLTDDEDDCEDDCTEADSDECTQELQS